MAGFEEKGEAFEEAGIQVVAFSADDEEGAGRMKDQEDLSFPVLYGIDVDEAEERLGVFVERGERTHLQPAQFILRPDGSVALSCYSSGAVGRLSAAEVLDRVERFAGG